MLSVPKRRSGKGFFGRFNIINSAADAIGHDVMYHNVCWADAKKRANPKSKRSVNYSCRLADVEITDFAESYLNDSSERVLDMNKIDEIYKGILMENGTTIDKLNATYKKYLNNLISENIENVLFLKHTPKDKAEQLIADTTQSEFISQVAENLSTKRDLETMWNVPNEIQNTLLGSKWKFGGDMNNNKS